MGIKGVGMTPLAIIAKEAGVAVSGSDIADVFITDQSLKKAGIIPLIGFSKKHVQNPDLVITTGAHGGFNNVEVLEAKQKNIKIITQGEAVGIFMDGEILNRKFTGISVTGTHGKTTTTAMIATLFKANGKDPSFVVGTGNVLSLGAPGHFGKGDYFVAEADEYMTEPSFDPTIKFMWQHPKIAVITNIEFDHPDAYKTIDETRKACLAFANQLSKNGVLVTCGDDNQVRKLLSEFKGKRVTYGFSRYNDFVISNVGFENGKVIFAISQGKKELGEIELSVFGDHNVLNAAAAFIVGLETGLALGQIKEGLLAFVGSKRRSEYVGQLVSGASLFDDYAHHPTEIQSTLKAFRQQFPNFKIVCIFQPHTYSRTKSLFEQFINSFNDADSIVLTNIYSSLREKPDPTVSSELLAKRLEGIKKEVIFLPTLASVVEYVNQKNYNSDYVLITMGAGDVYKVAQNLKLKSLN